MPLASSSTASSRGSARANSTLTATECPTYTGTRTQVAVTRSSGAWRILRLSRTNFHSSDV